MVRTTTKRTLATAFLLASFCLYPLATGAQPTAATSGTLYFSGPAPGSAGASRIGTIDLVTGDVRTVASFLGKSIRELAVGDDGTVYALAATAASEPAQVLSVDPATGDAEVLVDALPGAWLFTGLTYDQGTLYFDELDFSPRSSRVGTIDVTTGDVRTLSSSFSGASLGELAIADDGTLYTIASIPQSVDQVVRINPDTGDVSVLANLPPCPQVGCKANSGLAFGGGNLYFSEDGLTEGASEYGSLVGTIDRATGNFEVFATVSVLVDGHPRPLTAADDGTVYARAVTLRTLEDLVSTEWHTKVLRVGPAPGDVTTLADFGPCVDCPLPVVDIAFAENTPTVIFRESPDNDGFWFLMGDLVPGIDHVGFQIGGQVYESHPGYGNQRYVSADGQEEVDTVATTVGVQQQHTRGTFKHYSTTPGQTDVTAEEIPIPRELANRLQEQIEMRLGAGFRALDFRRCTGIVTGPCTTNADCLDAPCVVSLSAISASMSPSAQKGGADNRFTCVGLIEDSAERVGHSGGEGFIPSHFESFRLPTAFGVVDLPLLTPQFLNYAMRDELRLSDAIAWFQGFLDPVDFIVTDPLGRRVGFTPDTGEVNEIPSAFYSGDAIIEQFLIPNPLPGIYSVELVGAGDLANGGIDSSTNVIAIELDHLDVGERRHFTVVVEPFLGSPGDADGDGDIGEDDLELLQDAPEGPVDASDPRDVTGDGLISACDIVALERLLGLGSEEPDESCDLPALPTVTRQNKSQQACINAMSKRLNVVAKTQGKDASGCIAAGAKGTLSGTIESCLTADRNGKIQNAKDKTAADHVKKCGAAPDFGPAVASSVNNAGVQKEIDLVRDLFGPDLDTTVASVAGATKDISRCQQKAVVSIQKCRDAKLKEFQKCTRQGIKDGSIGSSLAMQTCMGRDEKGKIAKACDPTTGKLRGVVEKNCAAKGVDLTDSFPGCATTDSAALAVCVDGLIRCRVCRALNDAGALSHSCDMLDDDSLNDSCP